MGLAEGGGGGGAYMRIKKASETTDMIRQNGNLYLKR